MDSNTDFFTLQPSDDDEAPDYSTYEDEAVDYTALQTLSDDEDVVRARLNAAEKSKFTREEAESIMILQKFGEFADWPPVPQSPPPAQPNQSFSHQSVFGQVGQSILTGEAVPTLGAPLSGILLWEAMQDSLDIPHENSSGHFDMTISEFRKLIWRQAAYLHTDLTMYSPDAKVHFFLTKPISMSISGHLLRDALKSFNKYRSKVLGILTSTDNTPATMRAELIRIVMPEIKFNNKKQEANTNPFKFNKSSSRIQEWKNHNLINKQNLLLKNLGLDFAERVEPDGTITKNLKAAFKLDTSLFQNQFKTTTDSVLFWTAGYVGSVQVQVRHQDEHSIVTSTLSVLPVRQTDIWIFKLHEIDLELCEEIVLYFLRNGTLSANNETTAAAHEGTTVANLRSQGMSLPHTITTISKRGQPCDSTVLDMMTQEFVRDRLKEFFSGKARSTQKHFESVQEANASVNHVILPNASDDDEDPFKLEVKLPPGFFEAQIKAAAEYTKTETVQEKKATVKRRRAATATAAKSRRKKGRKGSNPAPAPAPQQNESPAPAASPQPPDYSEDIRKYRAEYD